MSIRTRLAIAVGLVLMVTLVVLGVAMVQGTRTILVDNVQQKILTSIAEFQRPGGGIDLNDIDRPSPAYLDNPVAVILIPIEGDAVLYRSSGYSGYPDDPPVVPELNSDSFNELNGDFGTIASQDGKLKYRARIAPVENRQGVQLGYVLLASPLDDVQATVNSLLRKLILAGVLALITAIAAVWLIIRQGLRPVERMIDTASAIAQGDLSQRVPESAVDPHTELGQLGGALNVMLGQIEHSSNLRAESEARLRQFVADAAHELRTPLTSLRGYAELYRQGALPDAAAVGNAMGRIESEGTRMARLVDELLLLARLDQQRGLELTRVDLADLCRDAIADFRAVEPDRPVTDDLVASAIVLGDRLRLRQVIDNLLTNVRVHTPPQTPVHVSITLADQRVQVRVRDDGPGIPPEDQPHVFERFWRGDRSRGRRAGSSGLGLSIVASLVESHGGAISLESEPGRGTTFTVDLPLAQADSNGEVNHPAPVAPGRPRDPAGSAASDA
jgi:two-component system OmpR family sensor kinase